MAALFDNGQVGSVGTLMGAALETCGHYLQSQLLDVFQSNLAISLGMLLFLIGGIAAIVIVAVGGNYKFGLYFLLGPALFFQTTLVRVPSQGARWQFADEIKPYSKVHDAVGNVASNNPTDANGSIKYTIKKMNVSWFFALWADFTSGIIQSFTELLHDPTLRSNITFVTKVERFMDFNRLQIEDPVIKQFLTLAFQNSCAGYIRSMQMFFNPAIAGPQKKLQIKPVIQAQGEKVVFSSADDLMKFASTVGMDKRICEIFNSGAPFPVEDSPFKSCPLNGGTPVLKDKGFTCADVWKMGIIMLRIHGQALIEKLVMARVSEDWNADGSEKDFTEQVQLVRKRLLEKFAQVNFGSEHGGSRHVTEEDSKKMIFMLNELAARLMVDHLKGLSADISQMGRAPRALTAIRGGKVYNPEVSAAIRLMDERQQWRGKGDFYTAALALPYIQGLLLYWLAAAYPFFAMALLIPGRHLGFTLWMGLWFWVKSWDFGYAMVMVIDEVLYLMFPHGTPMGNDTLSDPHELIQTVLSVDPIHSENMYYNLIAACMMSVPVITGVLVKKGGEEILSAIQNGYHNFAGRSGHSLSSFYASMRAQEARGTAQMNQIQAAERAGTRAILNNQDVRHHAATALSLSRRADLASAGKLQMSGEERSFFEHRLQTMGYKVGNMSGLDFQNAIAGVLREKADQHIRVVQAHIKRDMEYAAWHESLSERNRQLANDAVRLRYYSHDFTRDAPFQVDIDLATERHHLKLANVADKGLASLYFQGSIVLKEVQNMLQEGVSGAVRDTFNMNGRPMPSSLEDAGNMLGSRPDPSEEASGRAEPGRRFGGVPNRGKNN